MWKDNALKFVEALRETDFFPSVLSGEEREIAQNDIARNDNTRAFDVRSMDSCRHGHRYHVCARDHAKARVTGGLLFVGFRLPEEHCVIYGVCGLEPELKAKL